MPEQAASPTQIIWKWNSITDATGYKTNPEYYYHFLDYTHAQASRGFWTGTYAFSGRCIKN